SRAGRVSPLTKGGFDPRLAKNTQLARCVRCDILNAAGARAICVPVRPMSGRSAAWLARLVRDQEVEGSNPFAPTTSKILPSNGLGNFLRFIQHCVLWTNVDQIKTESGLLCPLLAKFNVIVEC